MAPQVAGTLGHCILIQQRTDCFYGSKRGSPGQIIINKRTTKWTLPLSKPLALPATQSKFIITKLFLALWAI